MKDNSIAVEAGTNAKSFSLARRPSGMTLLWCILAILLAVGAFMIIRSGEGWGASDQATMPPSGRSQLRPDAASADNSDAITSYDARDVKPLSAPEAIAINAAIPIAVAAGPKSQPFIIDPTKTALRSSALQCLTAALYYEAASEADDGQRAVAQVILNRMRHPAYPPSVCGVVYQGSTRATGCQFSFTCDGSLMRVPSAQGWARSRRLAEEALSGRVYVPVGYATHYHADYVVPYWAASLDKAATIGRHIFYRWPGRNGTAPAFRQRYAQVEQISVDVSGATIAQAAAQAPEVTTNGTETVQEDRAAMSGDPLSTAADQLARPSVSVAEDKRAAPSIVADEAAGTLKLPAGRATAAAPMRQPQNPDVSCSVNKPASPVEPNGEARISGSVPSVSASCSQTR